MSRSSLPREVGALLARQEGVASRAQLLAGGASGEDVRRWVRQRRLAPLHRGILLDHTGRPTWEQRAWGAVLATAPSALDGWSALRAEGLRTPSRGAAADAVVEVVVDADRRVRPPEGVSVRRVRDLAPRVRWSASPPRLRVEEAVLHVAAHAPDDLTAVGVLTDAVQSRRTTPARVREVARQRERLPRRALLTDVLEGLADGAHSVLEDAYRRRVERAHGLPRGVRQWSLPGLDDVHDVVLRDERVVVELDGREHHSLARDRFRDMERDARVVRAGYLPLRLGWGQLLGVPCETARRLGETLRERGWTGQPTPCARCR